MTSSRPLPSVRTYDARINGSPVRVDDQPPIGDAALDPAHDNARIGLEFFREVLGRDSIDGIGGPVMVSAHDQSTSGGTWQYGAVNLGDGGSGMFLPFGRALDVVVHEMTHGIDQHAQDLDYDGQPGALEESFADVLGETAEQWHENRSAFGTPEGARAGDWRIGEDIALPAWGQALRDMAHPGTAYANDAHGSDPQTGSMEDYVTLPSSEDWGGVHVNSGIPNRAAHGAALQLGSEKVAKIWYDAFTTRLHANADFTAAALATVESADALYGSTEASAVRDAWKAVGLPRGA